jgi:type I restriction enzyme S subunit
MTLGELFEMKAGDHVPSSLISATRDAARPIPCFGGNGIRGFVAQASHEGEFLLIGRQGALCGNVQRTSGRFYATEHAVVTKARENLVNVRWAFHMLTRMNLNQFASKSAQPGLAVGTLGRVPVPVPKIEEQLRVAAILDQFDALVNDLSIGLPAELAARRRQYEHYRDRLLTFREAA